MMTARTLVKRLAALGQTAATILGIVAAAYSAVAGQWWWLGAAVLVIAGTLGPGVIKLAALVTALALAAWPAAVAACVSVLAWAMTWLIPLLPRRPSPLDESALVAAVDDLPPGERSMIERSAAGQVDSIAIVRAALADDPSRWPFAVYELGDATAHEGGLVAPTGWTVVACEAALVAACRPDVAVPIDVHHLAGAALLLPNSAASARLGRQTGDAVMGALGMSVGQAAEQFVRAAEKPGAELIVARALRGAAAKSELTDAEWQRLRGPDRPDAGARTPRDPRSR
jgi:hypothetical protein